MFVFVKRKRNPSLLGRGPVLFRLLGKACRNVEPHEAKQSASSAVRGILREIVWSIQNRKISWHCRAIRYSASLSSRIQYRRYELNAYQMDRQRYVYPFVNTHFMSERGLPFRHAVKSVLNTAHQGFFIITKRPSASFWSKLVFTADIRIELF